jgi:hypothetical protein
MEDKFARPQTFSAQFRIIVTFIILAAGDYTLNYYIA